MIHDAKAERVRGLKDTVQQYHDFDVQIVQLSEPCSSEGSQRTSPSNLGGDLAYAKPRDGIEGCFEDIENHMKSTTLSRYFPICGPYRSTLLFCRHLWHHHRRICGVYTTPQPAPTSLD